LSVHNSFSRRAEIKRRRVSAILLAPAGGLGLVSPLATSLQDEEIRIDRADYHLSLDKMPRVAHPAVNDDSAGLIRCSVPVRREASGVAGLRSAQ
jgi:hypothetical protein